MLRFSMLSIAIILSINMATLGQCLAAKNTWVWWEGERPVSTNFPADSSFSAGTFEDKRDSILSGGDWLTIDGKRNVAEPELYAKYSIDITESGNFELWARKFWKHGPFRWRFDAGPWQVCGRDIALADSIDIRQYLCVNWVYLGEIELSKGKHIFELRLLAKETEDTVACFDSFVLSSGAFMPNGKYKPGEKTGLETPGWFAHEPGIDEFLDTSPIDLRYLNEVRAGINGHVRANGGSFVLGDGTPARFWAVNIGNEILAQNKAALKYMARKLAKYGVNLVRIHGPIFSGIKMDKEVLDRIHFLVSQLQANGIYTSLSFYFPLWFDVTQASGIGGYDSISNKKPFGIIYYNQTLQTHYRGWLRALMTSPNPYTGLSLGSDPAVAFTELVNEDSFFFWTFTKNNIPAPQWTRLERFYGEWLTAQYGSVSKALEYWGPKARLASDDVNRNVAALYEAYDLTKNGFGSNADKKRRVGDEIRFLAEYQRRFYAETVQFARVELKAKCLFSASNWSVTDGPTLDAIERWTYTACDIVDKHGYFGPRHEGAGSDYSVAVGHTYTDASAIKSPDGLPLQVFQVAGFPHVISELGWTQPNRFRAEWSFLSAAYGALQGLDGLIHFAVGSPYLLDNSMSKFQLCSPAAISTFPAAALIYRRGYVSIAKEAIHQVVRLDDLFALKGTGLASASALDELRKRDIPEGANITGAVTKYDALSFYVGPVSREYGANPDLSTQQNLSDYIDRPNKTVKSLSGELEWNYGKGYVTVNAEHCKGAVGFLGAIGSIRLGDVTINTLNEYASFSLVSLDGLPISDSCSVFIQSMTEDIPYGWSTDGKKITDTGVTPFNIKHINASIQMPSGGHEVYLTRLDANGYPVSRELFKSGDDGTIVVKLPSDAIYCVLEKVGG